MSKYQFRESDIYLPGTDIPKNRLGITEADLLHEIEATLLQQAYQVFIAELQPVTRFDEAYFKSLHQRTWASLYDWAGEYRSVDMSKHAEDTMREREIDFAWLAATMDAPETTEQHPDDPTLIYAFRRIPEFGNRVLRVVYNQTKTPPHIVTVYFDRTAGGKR